MRFSFLFSRTLAMTLVCVLTFAPALAGTVSTTVYYDNSAGPNAGGNMTVPTYDYTTGTLTDGATGIEFDATIRISAPTDFSLRTNGGTGDREWGVRDTANAGGNNGAIDLSPESVTAVLQGAINVTNFNGNDPGDVTVNFDGFTDWILFFVGNDGDAGRITDGSSTLFQWEGMLDPNGSDFGNTSFSGAPYTYGVQGASAASTNNALVDVSGTLPTTLVAEFVAHTNAGSKVDPNRWRVDDLGLQFTVEVIPEPATCFLGAFGLLGLLVRRKAK